MDQHEKQLGRAVKYGFRNDTKSGDERRVFGLPTLELSKRAMNLKENNVISFFELLNYNYNNKFGNCEEELLKLRSKEEMVKILGEMKVNFDMDKMDEFWQGINEPKINTLNFLNIAKKEGIINLE